MNARGKLLTETRLQHLKRRSAQPTTASGHHHVEP